MNQLNDKIRSIRHTKAFINKMLKGELDEETSRQYRELFDALSKEEERLLEIVKD